MNVVNQVKGSNSPSSVGGGGTLAGSEGSSLPRWSDSCWGLDPDGPASASTCFFGVEPAGKLCCFYVSLV